MAEAAAAHSDGRPVPMFPAATATADVGAAKKLASTNNRTIPVEKAKNDKNKS
jgi:hypothetical protein